MNQKTIDALFVAFDATALGNCYVSYDEYHGDFTLDCEVNVNKFEIALREAGYEIQEIKAK